jgi:hypothetical protein
MELDRSITNNTSEEQLCRPQLQQAAAAVTPPVPLGYAAHGALDEGRPDEVHQLELL